MINNFFRNEYAIYLLKLFLRMILFSMHFISEIVVISKFNFNLKMEKQKKI